MAGELNGHDVGVAVNIGELYFSIGGVTENSFTLSNSPIDLTSKSTTEWRNLMPENGLQTVEISVSVIFSSDPIYGVIRDLARNKNKAPFQIARGGNLLQGAFYVNSYAETSPDNDKVTATFTLVSDGAVTGL